MHDGCMGEFENGVDVITKLRTMGFSKGVLPVPFDMKCSNCDNQFTMTTFESKCPSCNMVYGVTPCSAFDVNNVKAAGIDV